MLDNPLAIDRKPLPSIQSDYDDSTEDATLFEPPRQIRYPIPPPTSNTLSKSQRAQLRRTSEKLRRVLGEAPVLVESDMDERLQVRRHAAGIPTQPLSTLVPSRPSRSQRRPHTADSTHPPLPFPFMQHSAESISTSAESESAHEDAAPSQALPPPSDPLYTSSSSTSQTQVYSPHAQTPKLDTEKKIRRFIHRHSYTLGGNGKHDFSLNIFMPASLSSPITSSSSAITHSSVKTKNERPLPPIPPRSPLRTLATGTTNPSSSLNSHPPQAPLTPEQISPRSSHRISSLLVSIDTDLLALGHSPRFDLLIPTPLSERRRKMDRVWRTLGRGVRVRDVFGDCYDSAEDDEDAAEDGEEEDIPAALDKLSGAYPNARYDFRWDTHRAETASPVSFSSSSASSSHRSSASSNASNSSSPSTPLTPASSSHKLNVNISKLFIKKKSQAHYL